MKDILDNAEKGVNDFNTKMALMFPNYITKAVVTNIIGPCVMIEFANVPTIKDAPYGIIQNASVHIRLLLSLSGPNRQQLSVYEIDGAKSIGRDLKAAGANFRLIKAKTPAEALTKLYAWFAKNQAAIASIPQKLHAKP
jgi:hypothetical protein